jgi:hypothetical protein
MLQAQIGTTTVITDARMTERAAGRSICGPEVAS